MNQESLFDAPPAKPTGEQRKKTGMKKSADRNEAWVKHVRELAKLFCHQRPAGSTFRIEQFREWATDNRGLAKPTSHHAWGTVPRLFGDLIEKTGEYEKAQSPKTNGHPVPVYRIKR